MTTPTQDAYAVCRYDLDGWIPLSSIADNPELVRKWILKTYPFRRDTEAVPYCQS